MNTFFICPEELVEYYSTIQGCLKRIGCFSSSLQCAGCYAYQGYVVHGQHPSAQTIEIYDTEHPTKSLAYQAKSKNDRVIDAFYTIDQWIQESAITTEP